VRSEQKPCPSRDRKAKCFCQGKAQTPELNILNTASKLYYPTVYYSRMASCYPDNSIESENGHFCIQLSRVKLLSEFISDVDMTVTLP
jgi:hypothetical protein